MNHSQGKIVPYYRRYGSQADCYRRTTVPAIKAIKTPAAPFQPAPLPPPIPREEED